MVSVVDQVPSVGLYSSAVPAASPPATRTFPSGKSVAVKSTRLLVMEPVVDQVPSVGLYSSAVASAFPLPSPLLSQPPATRTFPSGKSVTVKSTRLLVMEPVVDHLPVVGLYSSAVASPSPSVWLSSVPPTTRTCPLGRSVAV